MTIRKILAAAGFATAGFAIVISHAWSNQAAPTVPPVARPHSVMLVQNACVQLCQQKLTNDVNTCNYPEKEPQALNACLTTARANFDACRQAC